MRPGSSLAAVGTKVKSGSPREGPQLASAIQAQPSWGSFLKELRGLEGRELSIAFRSQFLARPSSAGVRLRGRVGAGGQFGLLDVIGGELAGEGLEEGRDGLHLVGGEFLAHLVYRHHLNGFVEALH